MRLRIIAILTGVLLALGAAAAPSASAVTPMEMKNLCGKTLAEQPTDSYVEFSEKGSGNSRTAILSAPGFVNDKTQNDPLEPTLLEYGDLIDVSFCGPRFFPEVVGVAVVNKIKQLAANHDNVVVILTSMSGCCRWRCRT
jgi:hypothetical protein